MRELRLRHSQRGVFGLSFGKKKSKSEENTVFSQTETATKDVDSLRETGIEQQERTTTELLSEDVRLSLEDLILDLAGGDEDVSGEISNIASILLGRAEGAEEAIGEANAALIDRARFEGTREVERLTAQLSRGAGAGPASSSFVAGATAEAGTALEIGLAGLEAELNIGARNVATQEFVGAAQTFSTGAASGAAETNALAQLVEVIRGAQATQETIGTGQETEQLTAQELLTSLIAGQSTTKQKSKSSSFGLTL